MTHRFPLKEIARQSGMSTATVDRAINHRAHVSPQTQTRIATAIAELEGQEAQLAARGRRMFFDFVIEAPDRFSQEVKRAAEHVLPRIGGAVCRPRFMIQEDMNEDAVLTALTRIAKRGSQGICLKVRDLPSIHAAVDQLTRQGIPVVTLVTDLSDTSRLAYVGLDNASAGRTAAYLIAKTVGDIAGTVLTWKSNTLFLGEDARDTAFTTRLRNQCPNLRVVDISGDQKDLQSAAASLENVTAVYSMGGGNKAILGALDYHGHVPDIYVAHDLDKDNRALIAEGRLSFILHHDLKTDLEQVFLAFLHHHGLSADPPRQTISNIQVITPENVPLS